MMDVIDDEAATLAECETATVPRLGDMTFVGNDDWETAALDWDELEGV